MRKQSNWCFSRNLSDWPRAEARCCCTWTSILGPVLLTGDLGGAVASNVRAEQPMFNLVFPVVFACIALRGLWLHDARPEQLLPLKDQA